MSLGRVDAKMQFDNALLVMREINRIQLLEYFRAIAPEIATELRKQGVVFPKAAGR